jgi:hypothetical protein
MTSAHARLLRAVGMVVVGLDETLGSKVQVLLRRRRGEPAKDMSLQVTRNSLSCYVVVDRAS